MGRKNKSYKKSLHQQAYDRLAVMKAIGESKKEAIADGTYQDKIFSYNTYKTYWKHIKYFTQYVKETYPKCTTLKKARKYVNEWLQFRAEQGLSAWTIHVEAKALGKLYGIRENDEDYFTPPKRNRNDIKRSRGKKKRDSHFSEENNHELIVFCKGTGLRRSELKALKGRDILSKADIEWEILQLEKKGDTRDQADDRMLAILKDTRMFQQGWYIFVRNGKGGRARISPIIGADAARIVERMQNTAPDDNVWQYINGKADIHNYRSEYATAIYRSHARDIQDIPYDRVNRGTGHRFQSDVYVCRKDQGGKKLDRAAMKVCSKALGHNRISVVADNYIRNL